MRLYFHKPKASENIAYECIVVCTYIHVHIYYVEAGSWPGDRGWPGKRGGKGREEGEGGGR